MGKVAAGIAKRRADLKKLIDEQIPKLEAAEVIAAKLKEIGEDTTEIDELIRAARAFTGNTRNNNPDG